MPLYCADCGKPAVGTFDVPRFDTNGKAIERPEDLRDLSSSDRSGYDRPLCDPCSFRRPGTVRTGAPSGGKPSP